MILSVDTCRPYQDTQGGQRHPGDDHRAASHAPAHHRQVDATTGIVVQDEG